FPIGNKRSKRIL
ncbi:hypothetical protein D030_3373B, partial [Vibrio parahaemolyticus AQ3810]